MNRFLLLLADPKRRYLCYYLYTASNETVSVDTLRTYLSDNFDRGSELVAVDLYHSIIPQLEAANVVEFDRRSETVRYYPDEMLERLLDLCMTLESLTEERGESYV